MTDVGNLVLFVFVLLGVACYIGTMVLTVGTRRDVAAIRALLKQVLERYSGNSSPVITVENDRRLEHIEAAILIDHESIAALKAGQELYGYKLDEILAALQNYRPLQPAISAGSLVPEPRRSLERESIKLQKAVAWLLANDANNKLTDREAATLANVSHSTINRARQWIRNE